MKYTRRRLLSATGVGVAFGTALTAFSADTVAYQSSTTMGEDVEVRVDWRETYNGSVVESGDESADGPVLNVGNAQPGDSGTLAFRVRPETDDAARVVFSLSVTANAENGRNEPERKVGDETSSRGELGDALDVAVWYDTGAFGVSELGGCDGDRSTAETTLVDGSLLDADAALANGVRLDDDCLQPDQGVCLGIEWSLPASSGNAIQGDSVETDLSFTAASCDAP